MKMWESMLTRYVVEQRAARRSERTIENRVGLLRRLARHTGTSSPLEVSEDMLLEWMGRGVGASSMQTERSDLR